MSKKFLVAVALLLYCFCLGAGAVEDGPAVIKTFPPSGAQDVDWKIKELTVTFSKRMMNNSWAWVQEKVDTFPQITGNTLFDSSRTTCVIPVILYPQTEYVIWINSEQFKKFKDEKGHLVQPYRWTFKTR